MKTALLAALITILSVGGLDSSVFADTPQNPAPAATVTNVSSLSYVKGGVSQTTLGFVVSGNTTRTVYFRVTGPSLKAFGVINTIPSATFRVFNSQGEQLPKASDIVGLISGTAIESAIEDLGGFPVKLNSSEPLAYLHLAPGSYTMVVSAASGNEGLVLGEIYIQ